MKKSTPDGRFIYNGVYMKKINVDSAIENLSSVMGFINSELAELKCSERIRAQIKLAIDELFGNICFYAYDSAPGPVTIALESESDPPAVIITFMDKGKPYNPLEADEPDIELSGEDRPIGGLGIFLVQSTMDDLSYEYKENRNIVTLKKYLSD